MLKFHPDKCKTMRIGRSKVEKHEYTLKADLKPMEETIAENHVYVFFEIWVPNWVRIFEMRSY
jgi:hypothetical protein